MENIRRKIYYKCSIALMGLAESAVSLHLPYYCHSPKKASGLRYCESTICAVDDTANPPCCVADDPAVTAFF